MLKQLKKQLSQTGSLTGPVLSDTKKNTSRDKIVHQNKIMSDNAKKKLEYKTRREQACSNIMALARSCSDDQQRVFTLKKRQIVSRPDGFTGTKLVHAVKQNNLNAFKYLIANNRTEPYDFYMAYIVICRTAKYVNYLPFFKFFMNDLVDFNPVTYNANGTYNIHTLLIHSFSDTNDQFDLIKYLGDNTDVLGVTIHTRPEANDIGHFLMHLCLNALKKGDHYNVCEYILGRDDLKSLMPAPEMIAEYIPNAKIRSRTFVVLPYLDCDATINHYIELIDQYQMRKSITLVGFRFFVANDVRSGDYFFVAGIDDDRLKFYEREYTELHDEFTIFEHLSCKYNFRDFYFVKYEQSHHKPNYEKCIYEIYDPNNRNKTKSIMPKIHYDVVYSEIEHAINTQDNDTYDYRHDDY